MITLQGVAPDMIANNLTPFEPTHPGELIRDELEANSLTQAKLAESIGVKPSMLNEIIKGKRGVNTEIALLTILRLFFVSLLTAPRSQVFNPLKI